MADKKYCKVRNHCHYTGEYRGAAHSICNLKNIVPEEIPIAFHNGLNYDYHFIIKEFAKKTEKKLPVEKKTLTNNPYPLGDKTL